MVTQNSQTDQAADRHPGGNKAQQIIQELTKAYWSELETVQNYIAASNNLIGVRAEEIKKSLGEDVTEELGHAQKLAKRIHILGGTVPGSFDFRPDQSTLQPGGDPTDVAHIIQGVIDAEQAAIDQYNKIISLVDDVDFVTQDMIVEILSDEEEHRRVFQNFLAEYAHQRR
jgi:bacterioferritin